MTANTTAANLHQSAFARLFSRVSPRGIRRAAPETAYALYIRNEGISASYATPEEADAARDRLPRRQREDALICDDNGWCLSC